MAMTPEQMNAIMSESMQKISAHLSEQIKASQTDFESRMGAYLTHDFQRFEAARVPVEQDATEAELPRTGNVVAPHGKPPNLALAKTGRNFTFEGDRKLWKQFVLGVGIWASYDFPHAQSYLHWAGEQEHELTWTAFQNRSESEEIGLFSLQLKRELWGFLGTEPRHCYALHERKEGLEIWRQLVRQYAP